MVSVIGEIDDVRRICEEKRCAGVRVGLVPTMGALHEGHLSLVRRAAARTDFVVVSIFVNPTQFGPREDLDKYPRDLEGDVRLLETAGAHLVFAPDAKRMYPDNFASWVNVERLTEGLCGASRPGHFRGVATVVTKFFNIVRPHLAVFGQKDAQQVAVIRRMARDLDMGVEIEVAPIVREPDGLALSSRNRYLDAREREQALVLRRALDAAEQLVKEGVTASPAIRERVLAVTGAAPLASVEYVEIVDPEEMTPKADVSGGALLALAVRIGATRLIDNTLLTPKQG